MSVAFTVTDLDRLCANVIRGLAIDAVEQAASGHPGMPMGMADAAYVLWTRFLRHNPRDPHWPDRDRFILSAGHGSMLLYALLHLTGYDLPLDELKRFRQWGSKTPGHPEVHHTPGVEVTTGPLGQGFAMGVGMALAARHLAARYNRPGFPVVDHFIYAIVSDGDLMEGISHEAASLAGHLRLGNLIYLYDDNKISIDGPTDLAFTEDVPARFAAYGWHVQQVDGHDMAAVAAAIVAAQQDPRPSLICCRTTIGYGAPTKAGTAKAHGEPLGAQEARAAKERLGLPADQTFWVPDEVYRHMSAVARGEALQRQWEEMLAAYGREYPDLHRELMAALRGELPAGWDQDLPAFAPDAKGLATRAASGKVLEVLVQRVPQLVGGSADLTPSNNTKAGGLVPATAENPAGRYVHFGVREFAMGAMMNGMALHGGVLPYGGTFLVFSDYMRPAIRLAALQNTHVVFVFTHDSIGLGEDGPTHQPIEHLASLRAIPGLTVIRPCDAEEVREAWKAALLARGPVALALTRQAVPVLDRSRLAPASGLHRGAYVLSEAEGELKVILIATGSEVHIALAAQALLHAQGIGTRVVSMPSWELFAAQDPAYRDQVLPPAVTARVAMEAGATLGWERWVGARGKVVGIDRFGASAPYKELYQQFGLTPERVAAEARALLGA